MTRRDIRILNVFSLRGPNLWTYRPVLEAWVDIGDLEDCPSNTLPGFVDRLLEWLPGLQAHRCSYGEEGGFVRRLREGTWPAHILEHVTLELQGCAGTPAGFGRARETGVRGVYKVAVRAPQEEVTRACLEAARELVLAAIDDLPFDVAATHGRLRAVAEQHLLGPSTASIVEVATSRERGIPAIRLSADNLLQLGYGSRQRRIWAAQTERTGAIADGIARNQDLANELLERCGLPVPARRHVGGVVDACAMAAEMGWPVVVKRDDMDPGEDGTTVSDAAELEAVWGKVAAEDGRAVVEAFTKGTLHRLLVVGGKLVAAARMDGGAGTSNVANAATDVTAAVHPATAAAACLAARVVGLDIAGVDIVTGDIALALGPQCGAITAVRSGPGLITHLRPASGEPRPVCRAVVDHLFPDGDTGRIPVAGITGGTDNARVARLLAEFLRLGGKYTGVACGDGLFLDGRRVACGDCGNWQSGRRVLMNRSVEAAVVENGFDVIAGEGLAYDRCQVGVVTRIDPQGCTGRLHISTSEQVFQVFRTQVDVVLPGGAAVLAAADPMAVEMAVLCDGEVIYHAADAGLPVIAEHLGRGGRAVVVRDGHIVLATAGGDTVLAALSAVPVLATEAGGDPLEAVLAATASGWALGVALHVIRTGLETFRDESGNRQAELGADGFAPGECVNP